MHSSDVRLMSRCFGSNDYLTMIWFFFSFLVKRSLIFGCFQVIWKFWFEFTEISSDELDSSFWNFYKRVQACEVYSNFWKFLNRNFWDFHLLVNGSHCVVLHHWHNHIFINELKHTCSKASFRSSPPWELSIELRKKWCVITRAWKTRHQ